MKSKEKLKCKHIRQLNAEATIKVLVFKIGKHVLNKQMTVKARWCPVLSFCNFRLFGISSGLTKGEPFGTKLGYIWRGKIKIKIKFL